MSHHKKHTIKLRSMYQWHRYIGASMAVFIFILAVTGIMLNHTERFELDKTYIQSNWLLNHYGISAPDKIKSYVAGKHWVSQWDKQLYLNNHALTKADKHLIGAVFYQNMIIIAQDDTLFAYTHEGDLIEHMTSNEGIPADIKAIGITTTQLLAVRTANGIFTTNQEFLSWQKSPSVISSWSESTPLPASLYQSTLEHYRGKGLNLERVTLDLHSGRLLGLWGIYFMDFVAILMIFLALSGFWIWSIRIIKTRSARKNRY